MLPHAHVPASRCTGYRPILDAFKTFAKTDPKAYTEEAIAASKGLTAIDSTANTSGGDGALCPSTGMPCDCAKAATSGNGATAANGSAAANGCGAENCCKVTGGACGGGKAAAAAAAAGLNGSTAKPTCEPIFPPELKKRVPVSLKLEGGCRDAGIPPSLAAVRVRTRPFCSVPFSLLQLPFLMRLIPILTLSHSLGNRTGVRYTGTLRAGLCSEAMRAVPATADVCSCILDVQSEQLVLHPHVDCAMHCAESCVPTRPQANVAPAHQPGRAAGAQGGASRRQAGGGQHGGGAGYHYWKSELQWEC